MTRLTPHRAQLLLLIALFGYIYPSLAKNKQGISTDTAANAAQAIVVGLFQSWKSATTVIAVIAELVTLILFRTSFKVLSTYIKLKKDGLLATDNRNIGKAFCTLVIVGSFLLVVYYPLFVVITVSTTDSLILPGMVILNSDLVDIVIASAFLVLLRRRQSTHLPEIGTRWKTSLEVVFILVMTALTVVKTTLASIPSTYQSRFHIFIDFFHIFTFFYLVIIIDIIISSKVLCKRLAKKKIQDKLISVNICSNVGFLLGTQALLRLAAEIILFLPPQGLLNINHDALTCVTTAVKFISYTWALINGVSPLLPRKGSTELGQSEVPTSTEPVQSESEVVESHN